jgi:hypothetical protein
MGSRRACSAWFAAISSLHDGLACPLMAWAAQLWTRARWLRSCVSRPRRLALRLCLLPFVCVAFACRIDEPAPGRGRASVTAAPGDADPLAAAAPDTPWQNAIRAGIMKYPPQIVPGRPRIEGSLEGAVGEEEMRRAVRRQMKSLDHCYFERLRVRPDLGGRLVARLSVDSSGEPHDTVVMESSAPSPKVNDPPLQDCVLREIKRWKFPAKPGQRPSTVEYPFVFAPPG